MSANGSDGQYLSSGTAMFSLGSAQMEEAMNSLFCVNQKWIARQLLGGIAANSKTDSAFLTDLGEKKLESGIGRFWNDLPVADS